MSGKIQQKGKSGENIAKRKKWGYEERVNQKREKVEMKKGDGKKVKEKKTIKENKQGEQMNRREKSP